MGTDIKDTYGALGKSSYVLLDPSDVLIVGLDCPVPKDPNHPLAKLADPDRINLPVDDLVASFLVHGWRKGSMIAIIRYEGKNYVVTGRRRTRAAREANKQLLKKGSDALLRMSCIPDSSKDPFATFVIENEGRVNDGPMARARKLQRFMDLGYDDESIIAAMHLGSKQTLNNLRALLNLVPPLVKELEAGNFAPTIGYDLGRLDKEKQVDALAKVRAETGTEKVAGAAGRERIKQAATGQRVSTSKGWSKNQLNELKARLEPSTEEPYADEFHEQLHKCLQLFTGDDIELSELEDFTSTYPQIKKVAKSAKADK